jgi:hypothetical protein
MFFKFDFTMIQEILKFVNRGLADEAFEINQGACSSLDFLNEYLYNNLKRPKKKNPQLNQNIQTFC